MSTLGFPLLFRCIFLFICLNRGLKRIFSLCLLSLVRVKGRDSGHPSIIPHCSNFCDPAATLLPRTAGGSQIPYLDHEASPIIHYYRVTWQIVVKQGIKVFEQLDGAYRDPMDRDRVVDLAQCQYRFFKHGRRGLRIAGDTNRSVLKELGTSIILIMTRWGDRKSVV